MFASDCEVLVTSDQGSGTINSLDETKQRKGAVNCDWVIIGRPGSNVKLNFLTQDDQIAALRGEKESNVSGTAIK